jgi:hypothetical protein
MAATLRYARNYSVAEKKVYSFVISEDETEFGLYADLSKRETEEKPAPILSKEVPESLEVIFENRNNGHRIDFFPQGNSQGGVIQVRNQKGKTLFIIINRITGKVEVKNIK